MTKILFMSDLHLNHCDIDYLEAFFNLLSKYRGKNIFISGDISDGRESLDALEDLKKLFKSGRIHYVLGNHDFWKMPGVLETRALHKNSMNHEDPFQLSDGTWVLGLDGFYDCEFPKCNPYGSNDMRFIADFRNMPVPSIAEAIKVARNLSENYLNILKEKIESISDKNQNILLITHVPAFKVKSNVRGLDPTVDGLYVNYRMGEYLKTLPHKIVILCGHTHNKCDMICENVRQISFETEYGYSEARLLHTKDLFAFEDPLVVSNVRPKRSTPDFNPFF